MKKITYQMTKLVTIKNLKEQFIVTKLFNTIGIINENHLNIHMTKPKQHDYVEMLKQKSMLST
jgi:hypothetical protein